jgi:hypothetical protein
MRCREVQSRFSALDVCEDNATRLFEIPFATVDQTQFCGALVMFRRSG